MMTSREIEEYRRFNSRDRTTFNRWLAINNVVGGTFVALIAIAAIFGGGQSKTTTTVQKDTPSQRADAK
jgi:hypothetical protein